MATYTYQAQTPTGSVVTGTVEASSIEEVQNGLLAYHLKPLLVVEKRSLFDKLNIFARVSNKERAMLARQIATMVNAGISILQAVKTTRDQTNNQVIKKALGQIAADLEAGEPFSLAIAKHENVFDSVFVALVRAAEASGKIEEILKSLADRLENATNFENKIKSSLAYPSVIIVAMLGMALYVCIKVIPELMPLFEGSNTQLPLSTRFLIAFYNSLAHYFYLYILGVILIAAGVIIFLRSELGKEVSSKVYLKIPYLSELLKAVYVTTFLDNFSLLLKSGVPIIEAIRLVAEAMTNRVYRKILLDAIPEVERGVAFSAPIGRAPEIPPIVSQMIMVGEQTGKLDAILATLAQFYNEETNTRIKTLSSIIEPVVIIIMGLGVAFVVFAVMLPIYQASQNLSTGGGAAGV